MTVDLSFYTSPLALILGVRGIDITDEIREKVTACGDPELLRQWLARAALAATAGRSSARGTP
ncbi:hypothetical protein [Streptomyces salyersiae]|uniref:Uncharacterized protein n=1 Tax=Streptomyces salyersiae TaxID=3075530 RepID=A0ABU2RP41_9ACTN|nr:hypothetical protein [Streptomyces sp. DSM 41770]MDT0430292.1 hypothetical protein [Streptomyces sp. DSM 41770]